MNIVHLQNLGGIGGIAVLTRDISIASEENNYFYFVFEGGEIADQIKEHSPVFVANGSHRNLLKEARRFADYCQKQQSEVIVEHTGTAIGLICAIYAKQKLKHAKLIIYWHSNAYFFEKKGVKGRIESFLKRLAYRRCDAAAAISNSVKSSYLEVYGYKEDKISVVYNGIQCNNFYSNRLLSAPSLPFRIIYIGRVFKAKGIHLLIDAVNSLDDSIKQNLEITIVGRDHDGYTEQMIEKTRSLHLDDRITFTGARLDVPALLAEADLFVHPAICKEGFGITLAEAMAASVPCIAFRLGAIPEVIDNGENGIIVDKVSRKALAEAIEHAYRLYTESYGAYGEMRNNARKKAEFFSIENTVKTLEALYR